MTRRLSFWMLLVLLAVVGWFFFEIVAPFLPPLFLAAVLALLFRPAYLSIRRAFRGHDRFAAVATTLLILLAVILPIGLALTMAGREVLRIAGRQMPGLFQPTDPDLQRRAAELHRLAGDEGYRLLQERLAANEKPDPDDLFAADSPEHQLLADLNRDYDLEELQDALGRFRVEDLVDPEQSRWIRDTLQPLERYAPAGTFDQIKDNISALAGGLLENVSRLVQNFVTNMIQIVVGFVVMAISLYYFLADGPRLLEKIKELTPLEPSDRDALVHEFSVVCRAVVFATIVAALVQGVLVGLALWVAGVGKVFLLGSLTVITSMIPFIGAAGVYMPVALYLLVTGSYVWGTVLMLYGWFVVSTSDNIVRMYVVGGQSSLHPLAVLITALGGLKFVGLLGIFIGPLVAALFYALLKIVHLRIVQTEGPSPETKELIVPREPPQTIPAPIVPPP